MIFDFKTTKIILFLGNANACGYNNLLLYGPILPGNMISYPTMPLSAIHDAFVSVHDANSNVLVHTNAISTLYALFME